MKIIYTLVLSVFLITSAFAKCELTLSSQMPQQGAALDIFYKSDDRFSSLSNLYATVSYYSEIDNQPKQEVIKLVYDKSIKKQTAKITLPKEAVFFTISTFEYFPALDSILLFPIKEQRDDNSGMEYYFLVYESHKPRKLANYFAAKQALKDNNAIRADYKLAKQFLNEEQKAYPNRLIELYEAIVETQINIANELECDYETLYSKLVNADSLDLFAKHEIEQIQFLTKDHAPKKLLELNKFNYFTQTKSILSLLNDSKQITDSLLQTKSILDFSSKDEFLNYVFDLPTNTKTDLDFVSNLIENYYDDKLKFETKLNLFLKASELDDYFQAENLKDKLKAAELAQKIIALYDKYVIESKSSLADIQYISLFDHAKVLENNVFVLRNLNYESSTTQHLIAEELVRKLLASKKILGTQAFEFFLKLRTVYIEKYGEDKNYKLLMQKIYYLVERDNLNKDDYFDGTTSIKIGESIRDNNNYKINLKAADEGFDYTLVNDFDLIKDAKIKNIKDSTPNFSTTEYKIIFYKKAAGNFEDFKDYVDETSDYINRIATSNNQKISIYPMINTIGNEAIFEKMKKIKSFDAIEATTLFCFDKELTASLDKDANSDFNVLILNKENKVKYVFSKFPNFGNSSYDNNSKTILSSQVSEAIFNYFKNVDKFD